MKSASLRQFQSTPLEAQQQCSNRAGRFLWGWNEQVQVEVILLMAEISGYITTCDGVEKPHKIMADKVLNYLNWWVYRDFWYASTVKISHRVIYVLKKRLKKSRTFRNQLLRFRNSSFILWTNIVVSSKGSLNADLLAFHLNCLWIKY